MGEAAGTHGVYRPGGSALNAGQAGSSRAAVFIAKEFSRRVLSESSNRRFASSQREEGDSSIESFNLNDSLKDQVRSILNFASSVEKNNLNNAADLLADVRRRMSFSGGAFRDSVKIGEALTAVRELKEHFTERAGAGDRTGLPFVFRLWDTLVCQEFYLTAMADFAAKSGRSRGSALYRNSAGTMPLPGLPAELSFLPDDGSLNGRIQEIQSENGKPAVTWRDVRPIPPIDESFEVVWKAFREES